MSSRKRKTRMTVVTVPSVSDKMRKPAARKRRSRNFLENLKTLRNLKKKARKFWVTVVARVRSVTISRAPRRLLVCESVSLGEKRVVAVVQFEQQRFLLGASANSISLLSHLPPETSFGNTLQNCAGLQAKVLQAKLDDMKHEEVKVAL